MSLSPSSFMAYGWIFQMAVEFLLLLCVWRNRKGWTAFLVYLTCHLVWSVGLFPLHAWRHPKLYFYAYWWGRGALFVLECYAVSVIIARIVAPVLRLSRSLAYGVFFSGAAISGIAWHISSTVTTRRTLPITRFVLSFERGLTTIEAVVILLFIGFASTSARRWNHTEAFVTSGFMSQALGSMLASALFAFCPSRYNDLIQTGLQVNDLLTFGLWLVAFYPVLELNLRSLSANVE